MFRPVLLQLGAGAAGAVVATVAPLLLSTSSAQTQLLPFQGRLTDAAGNAVGDGARVVEFKLYDAPTGGNVKWAGEVHKLSVNGGLVNTMLGSKASLGGVDFATATFLQITVDANGDGAITAADPPLLPRQSVVPAVFASEAGNSRKLNGADWTALMVDGSGSATADPSTGFVSGAKIQPAGVTTAQLAPNAVTSTQLADGAVGAADLANGSVTTAKLASGAIGSGAVLDGSIQTQDIAEGAVTGNKIQDGTIQAPDIASGAIQPFHLIHETLIVHERKMATENLPSVSGWQKRGLNRVINNTLGGASLNPDSSITLPVGEYHISASAPAYASGGHQLVMREGTANAGAIALLGTTEWSSPINAPDATRSVLSGIVIVSGSPRTFSLHHFTQVANSPYGLGIGNIGGTMGGSQVNQEDSVFTTLEVQRLK